MDALFAITTGFLPWLREERVRSTNVAAQSAVVAHGILALALRFVALKLTRCAAKVCGSPPGPRTVRARLAGDGRVEVNVLAVAGARPGQVGDGERDPP